VDLAVDILDDTGREGQEVADVAIGGEGDVDDLGDVECFLVGDLFRVDADGGSSDVDFLLEELDVGEDEVEGFLLGIDVGGGGLIEAWFFDSDFVRLGLAGKPGGATGVVGGEVRGRLSWFFDGELAGTMTPFWSTTVRVIALEFAGAAVMCGAGRGTCAGAAGRAQAATRKATSTIPRCRRGMKLNSNKFVGCCAAVLCLCQLTERFGCGVVRVPEPSLY